MSDINTNQVNINFASGVTKAPKLSIELLLRTIRLGIKSLWLHKLRSLLTVLGIVFGVCSVIAMLAIGEGASHEAQEQIKNLGSQNIILQSVKPPEEQQTTTSSARQNYALDYGLKYTDIKRLRSTIPGVTIVVPGRIIREYAWNLDKRVDCEVVGTVPWYPEMRNHPVEFGRFFTDIEMDEARPVCVLTAEAASALFPIDWPIGKTVRIQSKYYKVVGIMSAKANAAKGDLPESTAKASQNRMFIPLTTAKNYFGETLIKRRSGSFEAERVELHEVTIKVHNLEDVINVAGAIQTLLERYHQKKDYQMIVPLELLKKAERTKQIFNIVLGSIAAISLIVGGIGIMNIMLATVTERTREIGIRRALGARRRDIIIQFLIETVILSGLGGIIGVMLGVIIPYFVTLFANMATIVTLWSPLLAFSISAIVGVVFGIYPAMRAADMDPVEALRHE